MDRMQTARANHMIPIHKQAAESEPEKDNGEAIITALINLYAKTGKSADNSRSARWQTSAGKLMATHRQSTTGNT